MGFLFDEKAYIEGNIALHEQRMSSQFSRFLDSSPTFVTYYRINNIESTTDNGFLNVDQVLGRNSPIRFNEVKRLPLYGIEQIVLDLELAEEGLNTSHEGSAIILPNTVIPRPNDMFIIDHIGSSFVLSVTNIQYDTFRSNGYYRVDYKVRAVDDGSTHDQLKKQTVDRFICYHENIGTEDKVLMREGDVDIINALNKIVTDIANYYKMLYYDTRYNSFLFNRGDGYRLYDRVLTRFIIKNKIFSNRKGYETIHLADEDSSKFIDLEYHNSIFRAVEERKASLLNDVKCFDSFVFDIQSVFTRWRDKRIISVIQGQGVKDYLRPDLIQFFRDAHHLFEESNESKLKNDEEVVKSYIKIPDINNKPVYVKDHNIITTHGSTIATEEEALMTPRLPHEFDNQYKKPSSDGNGGIDLNTLFGEDSELEEEKMLEEHPPIIGLSSNNSPFIEEPEMVESGDLTPPMIDLSTEYSEQDGVVETVDQEHSKTHTLEVFKSLPEYLQTPDQYRSENIMTLILAKYFSGHDISLYEIDLEELKDYLSYMDLYKFETFILTPIFLYVLEQYFITHLGN